jgi:Tfp pilus assembly PilM family ATPase
MKNIIQNIFFPDEVRGYYIFSKTILGIQITDRYLYAATVQASGDKRTISSCIQKQIPLNEEMSFEDRLSQGLKDIIQTAPRHDTVHVSLPSNRIVFKPLTVPFLDLEKIKMIAPFEVEEHLPFSLEHAVIDVIITSQKKNEKTSDIIVAATQHETLMPFIHACEKASIMPEHISIDMFELFGLYLMIAKYRDIEGTVSLVEINTTYTNVLVIQHGVLISMRTLKRGAQYIIDTVLDASASTENIDRIDLHAPENQKQAKPFLSDIQFTIQAALTNNDIHGKIDMAIIAGIGAEINGIDAYMNSFAHESTIFQPHNLIRNGNVSFKNHNHIAPRYTTAVATALPGDLTQSFDLRPSGSSSPDGSSDTSATPAAGCIEQGGTPSRDIVAAAQQQLQPKQQEQHEQQAGNVTDYREGCLPLPVCKPYV